MRSKIIVLVVALVLGGLAAVMAAQYLDSAKTRIQADAEPIEVLVAQEDIPRGMSADELIERKVIVREAVPRQFVAADAVSSARAIEGQVLATGLSAGEQVTKARFQYPSQAGLAYSIPEGLVAVAISNDSVKGVAGLLKPGDFVMVVATFEEPTEEDKEADRQQTATPKKDTITRILLSRVRVLATGGTIGAEAAADPAAGDDRGVLAAQRDTDVAGETVAPSTVTLGLSPGDVEKLVFAEENGKVHLALLGATDQAIPPTGGRTFQTIFK